LPNELLLPPRAVLLHVGPAKTGTTALQSAFHNAREPLAAHGVDYHPRHQAQAALAARAITGTGSRGGNAGPPKDHWDRLVRNMARSQAERLVVSSETFAFADGDTPRLIVDELGGDRVHVVITLRPLRKIMPSTWQQYVQRGATLSYDEWLAKILDDANTEPVWKNFWTRQDHGRLVQRWVDTVGPDQVTVVVLDERDRDMLLRTFGDMLGVPSGVLVPVSDRSNRSLTVPEVELLRQLNIEFHNRNWMSMQWPLLGPRGGAAHRMKVGYSPSDDEPAIRTPRPALDEAARRGGEAARVIAASGARVVGDLATLASPATAAEVAPAEAGPPPRLDPRAAAQAVIGVVLGSSVGQPTRASDPTSSRSNGRRPLLAAMRRLVRPPRRGG
jgi:hypothetical protein